MICVVLPDKHMLKVNYSLMDLLSYMAKTVKEMEAMLDKFADEAIQDDGEQPT